ncbi:unnamed protein product [Microthlaspi erraticum]|uniref:Myb/SANT-like domain-containing protein n=1 Tax=Microthlaspi erraticum TaxID=1685480 RepID=A0A6D2KD73_9BRAS|nr:unnamed protein product [Microthlaspi erraticum]CAA7054944.1 unnamed protein product [Microthlaspi erraticum]
MTRVLLELITLEKQDGNCRGKSLSEEGKKNVLKELAKQYPLNLTWNKIKNRLDTLKKQYELYRKITFGSTGLGHNSRTRTLDAPEHWWRDKILAYPEAAKLRSNPLRNLPLLDVVFRDETVVVEESWQPRRGVHRRLPPVDSENEYTNNEDGTERHDTRQDYSRDPSEIQEQDWFQNEPLEEVPDLPEVEPSLQPEHDSFTQPRVKSATRNRKRKHTPENSTLARIAATMEERNGILEQLTSSKTEAKNSTEERMALVVKYVRAVPDLVPMTPLYWASLDLIAINDVVRGLFLALPDDEKLPFLKRQTKESRNDFFDD